MKFLQFKDTLWKKSNIQRSFWLKMWHKFFMKISSKNLKKRKFWKIWVNEKKKEKKKGSFSFWKSFNMAPDFFYLRPQTQQSIQLTLYERLLVYRYLLNYQEYWIWVVSYRIYLVLNEYGVILYRLISMLQIFKIQIPNPGYALKVNFISDSKVFSFQENFPFTPDNYIWVVWKMKSILNSDANGCKGVRTISDKKLSCFRWTAFRLS